MIPAGRTFYKMSGSGNDFVMIDARSEPPGVLAEPEVIARICARATGVGADGIVFLDRTPAATVRLTYLNSDGSRAAFCGNATLCTTRLATELGMASGELTIDTDAGILGARMRDGQPEIDLPAVRDVRSAYDALALGQDEEAIGFAIAGVPHLVIRRAEIESVDVVGRGRPLRHHASLADGANVNFVAPAAGNRWRMRTYERGVEGETLACGSGAVATATLLAAWGLVESPVELITRSGRSLTVRLVERDGVMMPSLCGEGRIVFQGVLSEI